VFTSDKKNSKINFFETGFARFCTYFAQKCTLFEQHQTGAKQQIPQNGVARLFHFCLFFRFSDFGHFWVFFGLF
jgi:hypothetical protein